MGGRGKDGGVVSKTVAEWREDEERISEEGIPEDVGPDDHGDGADDNAVGAGRNISDLEGLERMVEQLDEPLEPVSGALGDQEDSSAGHEPKAEDQPLDPKRWQELESQYEEKVREREKELGLDAREREYDEHLARRFEAWATGRPFSPEEIERWAGPHTGSGAGSGADQQVSSAGLSGAGEENDIPLRVIPYLRFQAGLNAAGVGYMLNNSVDGVGGLAKKAATRTRAAVKTARETRDKVAKDPKFKAAVEAGREAERKAVVVGGVALGASVVAGSELAKVKPAERGRERKLFE